MKFSFLSILLGFTLPVVFPVSLNAQQIEHVYMDQIKTAQLFESGNQQGMPILVLNGGGKIELEFDDMDGDFKNYYFTFVLCDYQWRPTDLNPFDYIKGFIQNRIATYRYSSIAFKPYTHYQAFLPDQSSIPTKSGNYLLKVYLNGDTSNLAFTKQFVVVDSKAAISAKIVQSLNSQLFYTHQRVQFTTNIKNINAFSASQQIKAVILQNNRWDIAQRDIVPTFVRGNELEYNSESVGVFPGGKEWRWLDLRSFRLQSDRVDSGVYDKNNSFFYLKPDLDRSSQRYVYYPDYNGSFNIVTYETVNPFWQGDYATVYFSFIPPDGKSYSDKEVYLMGGFTQFEKLPKWKMSVNPRTGRYEGTALLKQGYYNYTYGVFDKNRVNQKEDIEGNYWETENSYTILIYYKSFSDRVDQLIGIATVNSRTDKPGFSF